MAKEEIKPLTAKEIGLLLAILEIPANRISRELNLTESAVSKALKRKKHLPAVLERCGGFICQVMMEKLCGKRL